MSPIRRIPSWPECGATSSAVIRSSLPSRLPKSATAWASQSAMRNPRQRAVVTGASGFIGSALVRHLRAADLDVMAVDRKPFADVDQPARLADVAQERGLAGLLNRHTLRLPNAP